MRQILHALPLVLLCAVARGADAPAPAALRDLAADNAAWKGKAVTMTLRLRNRDLVFERIIFYDQNGHDIEFDLSSRAEQKRLAGDLANCREGMRYRVSFVVGAPGRLELVTGTLQRFAPVFVESLPEGAPRRIDDGKRDAKKQVQ